ncbi:hypothetical protein GGS21DRAFT_507689 [Xylaria nigripes]|nr:hypothetical protein GGS21DRAFT_507689 [Xylaria nigripes]
MVLSNLAAMTAAPQAISNASLATPIHSSRTTATVREHTCLFTHDLRRKQKRWRDGRLKYHTFNRRAMVYDDRGNLVGDTHWQEDYDLADGDEIELERGGVVVQVGNCVERYDQDLSELIDKRAQERAQRQAVSAARRSSIVSVITPHKVKPQTLPQKHIHDVIGTPSGHYGRAAVPTKSPYEERTRVQALQADGLPSAKRQKREVFRPSKTGYAQNLFGATLTLSGSPLSQAPVRHRPSKSSHTSTETIASPSSCTNTQNSHNSPIKDKTQIQTPLRNANGQLSRQKLPQHNRAQTSTTPLSIFPNPIKPVVSGMLDETDKGMIARCQGSELRVDQGQVKKNKKSVLNCHSVRRRTGGSSEVFQHTDPRADPSSGSLITGTSVKQMLGRRSPITTSDTTCGQRLQVSNPIGHSEDLVKLPTKEPTHDEPKTELRIKPRKKRGLLVVSELDATRSNTRSLPSSKKVQCGDVPTDQRGRKARAASPGQTCADFTKDKMNRNSDDNGNGDVGFQSPLMDKSRYNIDNDEFNGIQCFDWLGPRPSENAQSRVTIKQGNEHAENSTGAGERPRSKERRSGESDGSSSSAEQVLGRLASAETQGDAAITDIPPPRLASLGHKGIRSKEVIGFDFGDEPDPAGSVEPSIHAREDSMSAVSPDQITSQAHHCDGVNDDDPMTIKTHTDDEAESRGEGLPVAKAYDVPQRRKPGNSKFASKAANRTIQNEEALSLLAVASSRKQPIPRIINPATRGKKAAKPSDAAGQMPVCPITIEVTGRTWPHQALGTESSMPGFSRANGGPWSREAYDLFDFRRPP